LAPSKMKLLVCTDGSQESKHALDMAIKLMDHLKDTLVLYSTAVSSYEYPLNDEIIEEENESKKEAFRHVDEFKDIASMAGVVNIETHVTLGEVKEQILLEVENVKPDLLVMGGRGLGMISRFLLGSVSDYILHNCPDTNLLVVK